MKQLIFDWDNKFDRFLEQLDTNTRASLLRRIEAIENVGIRDASQREWIKLLDKKEKIFEIRSRSTQYFPRAVYFRVKGDFYFISHGFNKKTNKTPKREIELAKNRKRSFFANKPKGDDKNE
ncbi:type II toxin-antitoxin system RelE/ParE family toxin [Tetragenococcus solitarius]|uniref:Type II toxin-antitoxin system RelE/ParE family toxin n=1 Tax=Tetragenococcus solitarius TaxID=71453 RepID=A0ABN3YAJ4_9ENTE|nr:type II toxin-antitoxin system RelE/ParE family toxin [Tetragenococcus solitarius]